MSFPVLSTIDVYQEKERHGGSDADTARHSETELRIFIDPVIRFHPFQVEIADAQFPAHRILEILQETGIRHGFAGADGDLHSVFYVIGIDPLGPVESQLGTFVIETLRISDHALHDVIIGIRLTRAFQYLSDGITIREEGLGRQAAKHDRFRVRPVEVGYRNRFAIPCRIAEDLQEVRLRIKRENLPASLARRIPAATEPITGIASTARRAPGRQDGNFLDILIITDAVEQAVIVVFKGGRVAFTRLILRMFRREKRHVHLPGVVQVAVGRQALVIFQDKEIIHNVPK